MTPAGWSISNLRSNPAGWDLKGNTTSLLSHHLCLFTAGSSFFSPLSQSRIPKRLLSGRIVSRPTPLSIHRISGSVEGLFDGFAAPSRTTVLFNSLTNNHYRGGLYELKYCVSPFLGLPEEHIRLSARFPTTSSAFHSILQVPITWNGTSKVTQAEA